MENMKCNYCINKTQCNKCDKYWKDKFIPSEEVKKYFRYGYVGVRGLDGCIYNFDSTNEILVPTHSMYIEGKYYCPYCGERMYSIQSKDTLAIKGYCCICEGARNEIEYEKRKTELERKYEDELHSLNMEYKDKLTFCSDKLFEIKQRKERENFKFFSHDYTHFSTLNGKLYTDIKQIVR